VIVTVSPTATLPAAAASSVMGSLVGTRYQKHAPLQPAQRGGAASSTETRSPSDARTMPVALQP
jgi:hypothetical protein